MMNENVAAFLYLVAGILFILALRGLSSPPTARQGNRYGMFGMGLAVLVTLALRPPVGASAWALAILAVAIVDRGAVQLDPLLVALLLGEERVDAVEELARLGLERVGAPVPLQGGLGVSVLGEQLAGAAREAGGGRIVGLDRRQLGLVDLREALLGPGHPGQPLELGPRRLVGDVLVEEAGDGAERGLVVLELEDVRDLGRSISIR